MYQRNLPRHLIEYHQILLHIDVRQFVENLLKGSTLYLFWTLSAQPSVGINAKKIHISQAVNFTLKLLTETPLIG